MGVCSSRIEKEERQLARLRQESFEILKENEALEEEINRLTLTLALEQSSSTSDPLVSDESDVPNNSISVSNNPLFVEIKQQQEQTTIANSFTPGQEVVDIGKNEASLSPTQRADLIAWNLANNIGSSVEHPIPIARHGMSSTEIVVH